MAELASDNNVVECPLAKKAKLDTENSSENAKNIHENDVTLPAFDLTKVLQTNCMRKQICVQGTFEGYDGPAVMILEKQNFVDDEQALKEFFSKDTAFQKLYSNTIYGNYECFPAKKYTGMFTLAFNLSLLSLCSFLTHIYVIKGINAMVIHPATSKHIEKFTKKELYMIDETYDLYQKITVPYIESSSFSTEVHDLIQNNLF